jgi:hypothetical protein
MTFTLSQLAPLTPQPQLSQLRASLYVVYQISLALPLGHEVTPFSPHARAEAATGTHAKPLLQPAPASVVVHNFMLVLQASGTGDEVPCGVHEPDTTFIGATRHAYGVSMLADWPIGVAVQVYVAVPTFVPPL